MLLIGAETATTIALQITAIGIVIALLFLISIISVLGWMLRLPKETEHTRAATYAAHSVERITRILVPLIRRNAATDRLVALAAQMVRPRDGQIELLAIIEVPFMLPLDAQVEEDEQYALDLLDHAEAIAKHITKNVTKRILKARRAGVAIVHEAEERAIDMILMANSPVRVRGTTQQIDPAVEYVMKNAPCEVLILSSPTQLK
jgi:nucleotide-binding universal stress UspA family protein